MDDIVPPKLFSHLSSAADIVKGYDNVRIFSHHDADGISAAIILAKTMMRAGKGFTVTLFSALNDETVKEIKNCGSKCIIISDMGVSYLKELDDIDADVVVLDHHKGDLNVSLKRVEHINPHSYGIDGMTAGCGASMAMLFSVAYDQRNWDLVQIAFAGIVGDKQHLKGLEGINNYLFREGNKRGYIKKTDGRIVPSGDLISSLFLSVDPYIRGVSGNADGVSLLLKDAGIDASRSTNDLNDAERRKLSSLTAAKLIEQGVTTETMNEMISPVYVLKDWSVDAGSLASVLNSCGRSGKGGIGIGYGLRDRTSTAEAVAADEESRKKVLSAVMELDSKGLNKMKNIRFFDNPSSGFTGMLCEVAIRYICGSDMPVVGYSKANGMTKVSSRCTHELLRMGVDLSIAMRDAGTSLGGGGGGHKIASGAWFPAGKEKEFLDVLDKIIGEQLSAR
ncbi:MAG: DHH family phosphoesterase [Methanomassiliicoccaceae archaeon]|jgi:RecJ-like exonuclease|nr:DHH family phosphoesterase [Methanomassiliicoccaceae archaeon]